MARWGSALAVGALSVLAACSSGGGSDAVETSIGVPSAPSSPDTSTTTEAPTTTAAPPTTIDPAEALAAEVEADFLEAFRLTDIAIQDPADDSKVAAALEWYRDSNRALIEQQLDDLRAAGRAARPNPQVEGLVVVESPAVLASSEENTAVLQACQVDSWIIVELGAGPNGSDAVVNPDITSYRSNFVLSKVDGHWRIRGSESLGEFPGESTCPGD